MLDSRFRFLAKVTLAAALVAVSGVPAVAGPAPAPLATGVVIATGDAALDAVVQDVTAPLDDVELPPLPDRPLAALIDAVNAHSASLGFDIDQGASIRAAGMPPALAGRLAIAMRTLLDCSAATTATRLDCAVSSNQAAAGVLDALRSGVAFLDVNSWPSLFVDGTGGDDFYRHDYSLLVDAGGQDVYDNNAGGNLQDIKNGPAGSGAPNTGPAIGCEVVTGNFPSPTASGHDCIANEAVLLVDQKGNDVYGVFKPPRTVDHNPPPTPRLVDGDCTADPLIRRMVLEGSGFQGNGFLLDGGGQDKYNGKTAAQGSGHVDGIGILRDLGGTQDKYLAIRNSQGFSLVGDLGVLQDDGGNDLFHTYMPAPLDPTAPFQTPGSGGVVDDTNLCDNLPRMVQGAALLGGVGILLSEDEASMASPGIGNDTFIGAPANTQPFQPGIPLFHSSHGFGCDGGVGILVDTGRGNDKYLEGPPGRVNGATFAEPQTNCTASPGLGIFSDDGRK